MDKKFLCVMAVYDETTQNEFDRLQKEILNSGLVGTQTMNIPFHITLGSFDVSKVNELTSRIKEVCMNMKNFEVELNCIDDFNNKVLFISPKCNEELLKLHNEFNENVVDEYNWTPHSTLYIGEEDEVNKAREIVLKFFKPMKARIVGVEMGEFFPSKMLVKEKFSK